MFRGEIEIEDENNYPTIMYGNDENAPVFYRICPKCGRFVKADDQSRMPGVAPNATCKKCGRVEMPFMAWAGECGYEFDSEEAAHE